MQKAIEKVNEIKEQLQEVVSIEWEVHIAKLKPTINSMLHLYLPNQTTILETEILATLIFSIITEPRLYLDAPTVKK